MGIFIILSLFAYFFPTINNNYCIYIYVQQLLLIIYIYAIILQGIIYFNISMKQLIQPDQ